MYEILPTVITIFLLLPVKLTVNLFRDCCYYYNADNFHRLLVQHKFLTCFQYKSTKAPWRLVRKRWCKSVLSVRSMPHLWTVPMVYQSKQRGHIYTRICKPRAQIYSAPLFFFFLFSYPTPEGLRTNQIVSRFLESLWNLAQYLSWINSRRVKFCTVKNVNLCYGINYRQKKKKTQLEWASFAVFYTSKTCTSRCGSSSIK